MKGGGGVVMLVPKFYVYIHMNVVLASKSMSGLVGVFFLGRIGQNVGSEFVLDGIWVV